MVGTSALRVLKGDLLHKLAARAVIRDWKDGALATSESEQEAAKRSVALLCGCFSPLWVLPFFLTASFSTSLPLHT